jgi:hypothetical protein
VASLAVLGLGALIAVLPTVASGIGLSAQGGPGPHEVMSARGQLTQLYGIGLYQQDSLLVGVGNRGTDAVTPFLEVPVLAITLLLHRRRSLRATLMLIGVLAWVPSLVVAGVSGQLPFSVGASRRS